ncbi:hypothetical protein, partial [Actinotalea sp. C106]|uniref:hypothetical protein n=1 Tax=Actinotalea sp. C106 TaxID=2908644 RepID=UPI00202936BC
AMRVSGRARLATLTGCLVAGAVLLAGCDGEGDAPGGTLRLVSDTGRPSIEVDEGWVAVLPADDAATWALLDAEPGADLTHANLRMDADDVVGVGGLWQPVAGGRFDLPVDPGEYVLCFVVPAESGPGAVRGCTPVILADGDRVAASWGEAGFRAETR